MSGSGQPRAIKIRPVKRVGEIWNIGDGNFEVISCLDSNLNN